jgi:hypothetical protein
MRRILHGAQQPLAEGCLRSSRGHTDHFWLGGPILALIATPTPNRRNESNLHFLSAIEGVNLS